MGRLHLFILLFVASSLLFQLPPEAFAIDPSDIAVIDTAIDGDEFTELGTAIDVATFTIDSSTYAIVIGHDDDGVQIIDISDPANIVAKDAETDGVNGFTELDSGVGVDTFTIGSSTYAIVVSTDVHQSLFELFTQSPESEVSIDLASQTLDIPNGTTVTFPIDSFAKKCLLTGVDQLGYILSYEALIESYEVA